MDLERDGNWIEAGVWFLIAAILFVHALRGPAAFRKTLLGLAVTVLFFGGSDLVEAQTGAWWKPWWLLVWKAVCVLLLLLGFIRYFRIKKIHDDGSSGMEK